MKPESSPTPWLLLSGEVRWEHSNDNDISGNAAAGAFGGVKDGVWGDSDVGGATRLLGDGFRFSLLEPVTRLCTVFM